MELGAEDEVTRPRTLDELVALSPSELVTEWTLVGRMLLEKCRADFLRVFHLVQRADPHANASERMPNLDNWSLVGWIVMNVSDHNRLVIANTIVEAHDALYRVIVAREMVEMIGDPS